MRENAKEKSHMYKQGNQYQEGKEHRSLLKLRFLFLYITVKLIGAFKII